MRKSHRIRGRCKYHFPERSSRRRVRFSHLNKLLWLIHLVSRHLHTILHAITSLPPSQSLPSLLIVAHKADLLKTGSSVNPNEPLAITRVKTILERELEKRRASQSGGVGIEGLGAEDEKTEMGGLDCGNGTNAFKFDDWEGGEVAFISSFIRPAKFNSDDEKLDVDDGLSDLRNWLTDNI
jgi:signal recognition particle receptor subunit beta